MSAKYKPTNVIIGQAPPKEKKKKATGERSRSPTATSRAGRTKPPPPPKANASNTEDGDSDAFGSGFRLPRMRATSNIDDRKNFMDEFAREGNAQQKKEQTFEEKLNDLTKAALRDVKKTQKGDNSSPSVKSNPQSGGGGRAQERPSINTILKEGRSMDREIEREAIRGRTWTGKTGGGASRSPGPRGRNVQAGGGGTSGVWSQQQDAVSGNRTYNKHGVAAPSHALPPRVGGGSGGQESKDDIPSKGYSAVNTVEEQEKERKYRARFVGKKPLAYALWSHKMSYG
jgi:hypothetical protein